MTKSGHSLLPFWWEKTVLVGGFNPSEKYARQIEDLPQIGVKIKNL